MHKILVLPGDGVGPEVTAVACDVLKAVAADNLELDIQQALIGGSAIDESGDPLPPATLDLARDADAILLGAVGGPKWENIDRAIRPERGLLKIRQELDLFSNLRPAILFPQLAAASSLHAPLVAGLDLMIVRELTGGIYFGHPRGIEVNEAGERRGFNTLEYTESEIRRIAHSAFQIAMQRDRRVVSVDKANVLECSELWREVMEDTAREYPDIALSHMYVDNAAMQLIREPKQFDVMVTTNLFGDILSDAAAMLTGSIGMLPSASLNEESRGLFEPIHGSAPTIAGQDRANPLATVLSVSMMFRYSLKRGDLADRIDQAVSAILDEGIRTEDIASADTITVGTREMGQRLVKKIQTSGGAKGGER
ncbi:MAG: 3-isopropylmalate dehydrogenase [marine bacterium B5-7]|nr:MAG: 3-isopropylmalate dehydrogenase [marine bacterium B5-7]